MKRYNISDYVVSADDRGQILDIIEGQFMVKSAMYITGNKGAVRANHVHKEDEHYCLVLSGKIRYDYLENAKDKKVKSILLQSGDVVFTPAGEKHRFYFETEGLFVALAKSERGQKNYESDTTRVQF